MTSRQPVAKGGIFGASTQRPLSSQTKELLKGLNYFIEWLRSCFGNYLNFFLFDVDLNQVLYFYLLNMGKLSVCYLCGYCYDYLLRSAVSAVDYCWPSDATANSCYQFM